MNVERWKPWKPWHYLVADTVVVLGAMSTGWFRMTQIGAMAIGFWILSTIEHRIDPLLTAAGATRSDRLKWRLGLYAVIFVVIAIA